MSVDGADDVIGWFRFGKLGDSVDFDPNDICRVRRVALFDSIELVRLIVRVVSESMSVKSLALSFLSFGTSVIIGPEWLNGCVFKFGIGGIECGGPGNTVTTLIIFAVIFAVVPLPSAGSMRASDGLLFNAAKQNLKKKKFIKLRWSRMIECNFDLLSQTVDLLFRQSASAFVAGVPACSVLCAEFESDSLIGDKNNVTGVAF